MILCKMQPGHIAGVKALLDACFGESAWSVESITSELDKPDAYCAVAVDEEKVVGYIAFEAIVDEGSIAELAVDPEYRRKGVGRRLAELMLTSCSGVRTVCLEVHASNTAARALYEALDFQAVSVRKNYYDDPREDAVIMIKQIQKQEGI